MNVKIGSYSHLAKKYNKAKIISNINVTPLVDVMLVLLIIFMITAPMLTAGINVDLPETNSSLVIPEQDEPLTISVDKNNDIYILKTKIDKNNLAEKLKAITKEKLDTRIFIRGDKNISYGDIVKVFVEITNAGFTKVALITSTIPNEQ